MVTMPGMVAVAHIVPFMPRLRIDCVDMVRRRGGVVAVPSLLGCVDMAMLMFVWTCHRLTPLVWPTQEAGWISLSTTHLWFVMVMPSDS